MTSWLNKQRKPTLIELSHQAGFKVDEDLRKDDLIDALDDYLQKNSTRLSGNASFEPYYSTRRPARPRESSAAAVLNEEGAEIKAVARRVAKKVTKAKENAEENMSFLSSPGKAIADVASRISSPFTSRATPASRRVSNLNVGLPSSPTAVAQNIERATSKFYAGAGDLLTVSGIPDRVDGLRTLLSSVIGVQASILLLEAWQLQRAVFPLRYAFNLPAVHAIGLPSIAVKLPDFFILLRTSFWGPTLLWLATSIVIPLFFAFFYNLTVHPVKRNGARVNVQRYPYDPMTYSIAKAVATMLVYGAHAPHDWIDVYSARTVDHAMYGGYHGVLGGCAVSAIAAIWEATQR